MFTRRRRGPPTASSLSIDAAILVLVSPIPRSIVPIHSTYFSSIFARVTNLSMSAGFIERHSGPCRAHMVATRAISGVEVRSPAFPSPNIVDRFPIVISNRSGIRGSCFRTDRGAYEGQNGIENVRKRMWLITM